MSLIGWESGLSISNKAQLDSHGECGAIARRLINSSDGYFRLHSFFFFFFLFFLFLRAGPRTFYHFLFLFLRRSSGVLGSCVKNLGGLCGDDVANDELREKVWINTLIPKCHRFYSVLFQPPPPPKKKRRNKCKKNLKRILWLRLVSLFLVSCG